MDKSMESGLMVALVILIILVIWHYFYMQRPTKCSTSKHCKAGEVCGPDGQCHPFIIKGS